MRHLTRLWMMMGIDNLMKIISTLGEDTNVFVISHKSELEDAAVPPQNRVCQRKEL